MVRVFGSQEVDRVNYSYICQEIRERKENGLIMGTSGWRTLSQTRHSE